MTDQLAPISFALAIIFIIGFIAKYIYLLANYNFQKVKIVSKKPVGFLGEDRILTVVFENNKYKLYAITKGIGISRYKNFINFLEPPHDGTSAISAGIPKTKTDDAVIDSRRTIIFGIVMCLLYIFFFTFFTLTPHG